MKKLLITLTILSLMVSQSYSCDGRLFDKYDKIIENYEVSYNCKTCGKTIKDLEASKYNNPSKDSKNETALEKTVWWLDKIEFDDYKNRSNLVVWTSLLVEYKKVEEICAPEY